MTNSLLPMGDWSANTPYADKVVVIKIPSWSSACLSGPDIDVYTSDSTKRIAVFSLWDYYLPKHKKDVPAKKLLFPDPLHPTTTLCLGETGPICVWLWSRDKISFEPPPTWTKMTRFETLNCQGLDVHCAHWNKIKVHSKHSQFAPRLVLLVALLSLSIVAMLQVEQSHDAWCMTLNAWLDAP